MRRGLREVSPPRATAPAAQSLLRRVPAQEIVTGIVAALVADLAIEVILRRDVDRDRRTGVVCGAVRVVASSPCGDAAVPPDAMRTS
jgi:hypothetical protein